MNQKILTLAMCLALSATSALADGTPITTQKITPVEKPTISTPAKPELKAKPTNGHQKMMSREEAKKQFEERKKARREMMYKDLGLSPEQIKKADELDTKTQSGAAPVMGELQSEVKKLKALKSQKASGIELWKQENVVKASKTKFKKYFEDSNKAFEAILTKEQKTKYDARKKEMGKLNKKHKPNKHKDMKQMDFGTKGTMGGSEQMVPPQENKK